MLLFLEFPPIKVTVASPITPSSFSPRPLSKLTLSQPIVPCLMCGAPNKIRQLGQEGSKWPTGQDDDSALFTIYKTISSVWRRKGLTGYCFKYIDRPFCLWTDDFVHCLRKASWSTLSTPIAKEVVGSSNSIRWNHAIMDQFRNTIDRNYQMRKIHIVSKWCVSQSRGLIEVKYCQEKMWSNLPGYNSISCLDFG